VRSSNILLDCKYTFGSLNKLWKALKEALQSLHRNGLQRNYPSLLINSQIETDQAIIGESFINYFHSFIHYGDLYSAPSRLLLRSAPNPCAAKKKSFEARVECARKNPGDQLHLT